MSTSKSPNKELTKSNLHKLWVRAVSMRYNYRCAICKSPIFDCHHIVGRAAFVRFDPENGIALCRKHHNQVHESKICLVEEKLVPIEVYERLLHLSLKGDHITIEDREHFLLVLKYEILKLKEEDPWVTIGGRNG